ncbi:hypothetical protein niasHT_008926 [Heterodera trifolii]|uniref:Uncharacterized protein n=1 Tax=Heterodera trifolii TaxID=157864 RepID=A0ABD2LY32_9BILA
MHSKFAFFVIFATIILLFFLDETLAGCASSKQKSGAKRNQRGTLASDLKSGRPKQIGMGVLQQKEENVTGFTLRGKPGSPRREKLLKGIKDTKKWFNQPSLPSSSSDCSEKKPKAKRQKESRSNSRKTFNDKNNYVSV